MHAIDGPLVGDSQGMAEVEEQVVRRHSPSREEVLAHPVIVARGLEMVSQGLVQEDVHEQQAALL